MTTENMSAQDLAIARGDVIPDGAPAKFIPDNEDDDTNDDLGTVKTTATTDPEGGTDVDDNPVDEGKKTSGEATDDESDDDDSGQPRDDKGRFKSEPKIPKARFDEAVAKEREAKEAAERRVAELEKKLQREERATTQNAEIEGLESEITGLEKEHAKLLLDGEVDKAAEVMGKIRRTERQIAKLESSQQSEAITEQALESQRVDIAIAKLEADYPQLNRHSEEYDMDMVEFVLAKQRTLISQGYSPSEALTLAGAKVMERFTPKTAPAKDEKAELDAAKKKQEDDRKAKQVEKNLDTQNRQPTSMKEAGLDSDKIGEKAGGPDVSRMTEEEFAALPAATKAKLRGDYL